MRVVDVVMEMTLDEFVPTEIALVDELARAGLVKMFSSHHFGHTERHGCDQPNGQALVARQEELGAAAHEDRMTAPGSRQHDMP